MPKLTLKNEPRDLEIMSVVNGFVVRPTSRHIDLTRYEDNNEVFVFNTPAELAIFIEKHYLPRIYKSSGTK